MTVRQNTTRVLNPETASEAGMVNLLTRNQQAANEVLKNYVANAAAGISGFGQAARLGGLVVDTSAAPGLQAPGFGQYSGMLQRSLTGQSDARTAGLKMLARLRRGKLYQQELAGAVPGTAGAIGSYSQGQPPTPTYPTQPIL